MIKLESHGGSVVDLHRHNEVAHDVVTSLVVIREYL